MQSNIHFLISRTLSNYVRRFSSIPHNIFDDLSIDHRPNTKVDGAKKVLSPTQCKQIIDTLRYPNQSNPITLRPDYHRSLWFLPYNCQLINYKEEFVGVLDDWWIRIRPHVQSKRVKISSLLIHLGKLQQDFPDVSIMEKIGGWKSIDLMLQRMVEIGFDRYLCMDINSAFAGLLSLSSNRFRSIRDLQHFRAWIDALHEYIIKKSPSGPDWDRFLEMDTSVTLSLFRQLEMKPPIDLLITLCKFSKMGLDMRESLKEFESRSIVLTNYADAMIWFNINPDSLVADSWKSWYSAWDHLLETCKNGRSLVPPLNAMAQPVIVAAEFDLAHIFAPIFHSWRSVFTSSLLDPRWTSFHDSDVQLANTIYNLGKLIWQITNIDFKRREITSIIEIMKSLQGVLARIGLISTPDTNINRVLSGFMYLKWTIEKIDRPHNRSAIGFPSREFMNSLEKRYRNETVSPMITSRMAAECLLLLSKLRTPPSPVLLKCILDRILTRLDRLDEKVLCYSGEACIEFLSSQSPNDHFWTVWFEAVEKFLESPIYSSPDQANIGMPYLLSVIVDAAYRGRRYEDFRRVQPLWEGRLMEILKSGKELKVKNRRKKIVHCVITLAMERNWKFDPGLLKRIIALKSPA